MNDSKHRKPIIDFFMDKFELPESQEDEDEDNILYIKYPKIFRKIGSSNFGMRYRIAYKYLNIVEIEFENGEYGIFTLDDLLE